MSKKAMVIDLTRCAGCYACVVACQMQNNTRPGVAWNQVERCEWGDYPEAGRSYLPHACMQCEAASCVEACPTGASYTREDGITLVNYDECICCEQCVHACPYGARRVNTANAYWFEAAVPTPYEGYGIQRTDVVEKCIFCNELVDAGGQPACVANCPGGARVFGDIDDMESAVAQKAAGALRIDKTSFYYVPVKGMPDEIITGKVLAAKPAPRSGRKPAADATPALVGAGVVAAAAVGAAVGYGARGLREGGRRDAAGTSEIQDTAGKGGEQS
ncbi:MAG: 4Fe-4S dicluster domain-containing protein [Coriobacteriales bacterium]|jgi:Fe-S-cluster-containing dehydrogenase component|nr:4Fe-4S dicluster domain-containing protein [Coriobacteriales bacterium]